MILHSKVRFISYTRLFVVALTWCCIFSMVCRFLLGSKTDADRYVPQPCFVGWCYWVSGLVCAHPPWQYSCAAGFWRSIRRCMNETWSVRWRCRTTQMQGPKASSPPPGKTRWDTLMPHLTIPTKTCCKKQIWSDLGQVCNHKMCLFCTWGYK